MSKEYYRLQRKYINSYFELTKPELTKLYYYMFYDKISDSSIDVIWNLYKKEGFVSSACPSRFMNEIDIPCHSLSCRDCWRTAIGWYNDKEIKNYWRVE